MDSTDLTYRISNLMADFVRFAIQDALPDTLDVDDDHATMKSKNPLEHSYTKTLRSESENQDDPNVTTNNSTSTDACLTPKSANGQEDKFNSTTHDSEDNEVGGEVEPDSKFSRSLNVQKMLQSYFMDRNRTSCRNKSFGFCKQSRTRFSWHHGSQRHYKTELCKRYLNSSSGECCYGEKCQFAHGLSELRFAPRHFRYKSEICYSFHVLGVCTYGKRCDFIHDESVEKLRIIRLQNHLLHMYRKVHPEVRDIRLVELLGLVPKQEADHQYWSLETFS